LFADTIVPHVEDGDAIWIHDYHLLLLPSVLRKKLRHRKNVKIGLFLHTPFPSEDYFSILPFREAICDGLLSCDLVGFHVDEYAKDFLDSATRVLKGVERSPSDLHYEGRKLIVHSFPIGIDPAEFREKLESEATQNEISALEKEFKGKKVLIGVDRLDYIKGIPQKLLAFDKFLSDNPDWIGKVVLIQLAIPTRPNVEAYIKLRREVESLVGNINGKHGD
jgi:trehalose 6-phosphate synthase